MYGLISNDGRSLRQLEVSPNLIKDCHHLVRTFAHADLPVIRMIGGHCHFAFISVPSAVLGVVTIGRSCHFRLLVISV